MSGTADSESERAYFRAIEETFIRLRGTPFLLSPEDWLQARGWYREGVPLSLVLETIESLFQRRLEAGKSSKIQSLRYCAGAVEAAWEELAAVQAGGAGTEVRPVDSQSVLQSLTKALPQDLPERDRWCLRIGSLSGTAEQIERQLQALDRELVETSLDRLEEADRRSLLERTEKTLEELGERLDRESLSETRERLVQQSVRRHLRLPLLSLFSPDLPS